MELNLLESSAREIIDYSQKEAIKTRISGSLGYRLRCPEFGYLQLRNSRQIGDIDLVAYLKDKQKLEKLMEQIGYKINKELAGVPGLRRSVFYSCAHGFHCDIFYDTLDFCHTIDLRHRLEIDYPTIPLMELLLQKLQIIKINQKDIYDLQTLLRKHVVGNTDEQSINLAMLSNLCRNDWGLWQTVTINLSFLESLTLGDEQLSDDDKNIIKLRIDKILESVNLAPKTMLWKLRSLLGRKIRWYNEVEEINHQQEAGR